jgi:hypothetical protein
MHITSDPSNVNFSLYKQCRHGFKNTIVFNLALNDGYLSASQLCPFAIPLKYATNSGNVTPIRYWTTVKTFAKIINYESPVQAFSRVFYPSSHLHFIYSGNSSFIGVYSNCIVYSRFEELR